MGEWKTYYYKNKYGKFGNWYMDYPVAIVNNKIAILRCNIYGNENDMSVKLENYIHRKNENGQYHEGRECAFYYNIGGCFRQIEVDMTGTDAEYDPETKTFHWGGNRNESMDFEKYVDRWYKHVFICYLRIDSKEGRRNRYRRSGGYTISQWSMLVPIMETALKELIREQVQKIQRRIDKEYEVATQE